MGDDVQNADITPNKSIVDLSRGEPQGDLPESLQLRRDPVLNSFYGLSGKIGILGGSFDPVQRAHIEIARIAKKEHGLDKVVLIPAYQNPLKDRKAVSGDNRLEMLKLALQDDPDIFVCPMELSKAEPSYTVSTMQEITNQLEGKGVLHFLAGSDCLESLHKWKDIHTLLSLVEFTPLARDDSFSKESIPETVSGFNEEEVKNLQRNAIVCDVIPISSTDVRNAIGEGSIPRHLLPSGVGLYIETHGLYGFGEQVS
jgi:nicotinate-nucleotide adenylyltransferase